MDHIVAASGAFSAFSLVSCMLIVKPIWTCHMEFVLYKLIIIIIIIMKFLQPTVYRVPHFTINGRNI